MRKLYNRIKKSVKWNVYVWNYCAKRNPFYKKTWKFLKRICQVFKKIYAKPFVVAMVGSAGIGFTTAGLVFLDAPAAIVIKMLVVCACVTVSGILIAGLTSDDEAWR